MKLDSNNLLEMTEKNGIKFRIKNDTVRPTIHEKLLDFAYMNLINSLGITNSEYSIALKANNNVKINVMMIMSYVAIPSRSSYLRALSHETRLPSDRNVYLLFEKYCDQDVTVQNISDTSIVDMSTLSDRDILMLLAERSLKQNEQIEILMEDTRGIKRKMEKVVIRILFALKRLLAMFWADKYGKGEATKENPIRPENSESALRYNLRIDALGVDEIKRQRTQSNTQRLKKDHS